MRVNIRKVIRETKDIYDGETKTDQIIEIINNTLLKPFSELNPIRQEIRIAILDPSEENILTLIRRSETNIKFISNPTQAIINYHRLYWS
jgi:hypothetical protein